MPNAKKNKTPFTLKHPETYRTQRSQIINNQLYGYFTGSEHAFTAV